MDYHSIHGYDLSSFDVPGTRNSIPPILDFPDAVLID